MDKTTKSRESRGGGPKCKETDDKTAVKGFYSSPDEN